MFFKKSITLVSLISASTFALAGMGEVSGDTNCTAILSFKKKLFTTTACHFEARIGSSMTYNIEQIEFTVPTGYIIETDNSSTFNFDNNGQPQNMEFTQTLNGTEAEVVLVDAKTLHIFSDSESNALYQNESTDFSELLTCYKPIGRSDAFCYPDSLLSEYM